MVLKPTESGGRVAEGRNAYGRFNVEWSADGRLISEAIEIKHPLGEPPHAVCTSEVVCDGCGGAKYRPQDFNHPGGADELIQQMD